MKNRLSVSIGIAAYNCEDNIFLLLKSLLMQKIIGKVDQIIVYSDAGQDQTVEVAKKVKGKKIKVIDAKKRQGFAHAVEMLLRLNKSDIIILLNDDIKISDSHFIEKISNAFTDKRIGLVTANPQPMRPQAFIEKAANSAFRVYEKMRYTIRGGNNEFTCDGKVLALSKPFIKSLRMPKNYEQIGNTDSFLYFSCLANGFKYKHVKNAVVKFKLPSNLKDYISLTVRNNTDPYILKGRFGKAVEMEYKKPKLAFYYFGLIEFIKNPIGSIPIFIIGLYVRYKARQIQKAFNPTWDLVKSTKNLNHV